MKKMMMSILIVASLACSAVASAQTLGELQVPSNPAAVDQDAVMRAPVCEPVTTCFNDADGNLVCRTYTSCH